MIDYMVYYRLYVSWNYCTISINLRLYQYLSILILGLMKYHEISIWVQSH